MKHIWILAVLMALSAGACRNNQESAGGTTTQAVADSALGVIVADTIIYDVTITSANPEDPWEREKLKDLHTDKMLDNLFSMLYNGKAEAFNHDTGEKLTIRQVEDIEKEEGFTRNDIGMIQFREAWFINPETAEMNKKVISMVLGMPRYGDGGELIGHKALFRIELPDF